MITNIEIDDNFATELETAAKARGISTRDFIRNALRQAVEAPVPVIAPAPFVQKVHDFGTHVESPWTILVDMQSEEYLRKFTRK